MGGSPVEVDCQIAGLARIGEGLAGGSREPVIRRLKLMIRRRLSPSAERRIKRWTNAFANWLRRLTGRSPRPAHLPISPPSGTFQAGDLVRVRSREEIDATLDNWHQLQGCTFMPEMAQYCGTTQRVRKPLKRFVDERALRVRKCRGTILLEEVTCQGTSEFGPCDRSCYLFWREEWLEKMP